MRQPNAAARRATSRPTRPKPTMPSVLPRISPCGSPLLTQLESHDARPRNSPSISRKRCARTSIVISTYSAIAVSCPKALHTMTRGGSADNSIRSMPVATDCTSLTFGAGGYSRRHILVTMMSAPAADPLANCFGSATISTSSSGASVLRMPFAVSAATLPTKRAFITPPSRCCGAARRGQGGRCCARCRRRAAASFPRSRPSNAGS